MMPTDKIIKGVKNPERIYPYIRNTIVRRELEKNPNKKFPGLQQYRDEIESSALHSFLQSIELDGIGAVPPTHGINLYCSIRFFKPNLLVETGVANGVSTAYILKALDRNGSGKLYSIDLPNETKLKEKNIGWVIPKELKGHWKLYIGKSYDLLPGLLEELGSIDFFMHDSEHSFENMSFEFHQALQYLKKGGVLFSDDIGRNSAFYDIAEDKQKEIYLIGKKIGFIVV